MPADVILNIQEDKSSWNRMVNLLESLPAEEYERELFAMVQGYCLGKKHAQEAEVPKKLA